MTTHWRIAEAIVDKRRAFTLSLLERGLCTTVNDFARMYGHPEVFLRVVHDLQADGLISYSPLSIAGGLLKTTTEGKEAIRILKEMGRESAP